MRRVLETPRLVVKPTAPDHALGMWEAIEPSLPELRPWLPWAIAATYETTHEFTKDATRAWDENTDWGFTIFFGGRPIGGVGLTSSSPRTREILSIGYWLKSDLTGKGLMTEAASAAVEFAFRDLLTHRLELRASPGNSASVRVAEKLGFSQEGLLRLAGRGEGGYHDLYIFGLTETDQLPRFHLSEGGP